MTNQDSKKGVTCSSPARNEAFSLAQNNCTTKGNLVHVQEPLQKTGNWFSMHSWEETRRLFIPTQGLPLWNYIFPMTLILFPCAWTQRCHVYFMFCHDFPSWKPQQSGEWAGETHRCLGFGPARFQWSPRTDRPTACNEATKSRRVLINLSLHQTRLLK